MILNQSRMKYCRQNATNSQNRPNYVGKQEVWNCLPETHDMGSSQLFGNKIMTIQVKHKYSKIIHLNSIT